jgi:hypothetical protein
MRCANTGLQALVTDAVHRQPTAAVAVNRRTLVLPLLLAMREPSSNSADTASNRGAAHHAEVWWTAVDAVNDAAIHHHTILMHEWGSPRRQLKGQHTQ